MWLKFLPPATILGITMLAGSAATADCKPGGLFCWPSEPVVRAYLAERYPHIEIRTLKFSSSPFGRPEDTSQRFRVNFEGTAVAKEDLLREAETADVQAGCALPNLAYRNDNLKLLKRQAAKGETVAFVGDTAMSGVDGKWEGGADLLNLKKEDGTSIYGSKESMFEKPFAIIGDESGKAACEEIRKTANVQ